MYEPKHMKDLWYIEGTDAKCMSIRLGRNLVVCPRCNPTAYANLAARHK